MNPLDYANGADPAGGALALLLFAIGAYIVDCLRYRDEQREREARRKQRDQQE